MERYEMEFGVYILNGTGDGNSRNVTVYLENSPTGITMHHVFLRNLNKPFLCRPNGTLWKALINIGRRQNTERYSTVRNERV